MNKNRGWVGTLVVLGSGLAIGWALATGIWDVSHSRSSKSSSQDDVSHPTPDVIVIEQENKE